MNCFVLKMYHICTSFFTFVLGLVLSSHYDIVPTVALDTASTGCCGSKVKYNSNLYRNPSHPFSKEKGNEPLRLASSSITNLRSWTVVSNVTSSLILECRKSVSSWIKLLELLPKGTCSQLIRQHILFLQLRIVYQQAEEYSKETSLYWFQYTLLAAEISTLLKLLP